MLSSTTGSNKKQRQNSSGGGRGMSSTTVVQPFNIKDERVDCPLHPIREKFTAPYDHLIATTFGKEMRDMHEIPCYGDGYRLNPSDAVLSVVAFQGGIGQQQFKYRNTCGSTGTDTVVNADNFNHIGYGGEKSRRGDHSTTNHKNAHQQQRRVNSANNNTIRGHPHKVNRFASAGWKSDTFGGGTMPSPIGTSATDAYMDAHSTNPNVSSIPSDVVNYEKLLDPHRYERRLRQQEQHQRAVLSAEQQRLRGSCRAISAVGGFRSNNSNNLSALGFGGGAGGTTVSSSSPHRSTSPSNRSQTPTLDASNSTSNPFGGGGFGTSSSSAPFPLNNNSRFGTVRDTAAAIEATECRSTRPKHYEQVYFGTGGTIHGFGSTSPSASVADTTAANCVDNHNKNSNMSDAMARFRNQRTSSGRKLVGANGRNDLSRSALTGLLTSTFQGRTKGSGLGVGCSGGITSASAGDGGVYGRQQSAADDDGTNNAGPGPSTYSLGSLFDKAARKEPARLLRSGDRKSIALNPSNGLVGVETNAGAAKIREERLKMVERLKSGEVIVDAHGGANNRGNSSAAAAAGGTTIVGIASPSSASRLSSSLNHNNSTLYTFDIPHHAVGGGSGDRGLSSASGSRPPRAPPLGASSTSVAAAAPTALPLATSAGAGAGRSSSVSKRSLSAAHDDDGNGGGGGVGVGGSSADFSSTFGTKSYNAQLRVQHMRRDRVTNATPDRLF